MECAGGEERGALQALAVPSRQWLSPGRAGEDAADWLPAGGMSLTEQTHEDKIFTSWRGSCVHNIGKLCFHYWFVRVSHDLLNS